MAKSLLLSRECAGGIAKKYHTDATGKKFINHAADGRGGMETCTVWKMKNHDTVRYFFCIKIYFTQPLPRTDFFNPRGRRTIIKTGCKKCRFYHIEQFLTISRLVKDIRSSNPPWTFDVQKCNFACFDADIKDWKLILLRIYNIIFPP